MMCSIFSRPCGTSAPVAPEAAPADSASLRGDHAAADASASTTSPAVTRRRPFIEARVYADVPVFSSHRAARGEWGVYALGLRPQVRARADRTREETHARWR